MAKTNIAILGAAGRMGQMTLREVMADDTAACSGLLVRPGSADEGKAARLADSDAGTGLSYSSARDKVFQNSDVAIDFSTTEAALENVNAAKKAGLPIAIGVTGFSGDALKKIEAAGKSIPVLLSYNMSPGINALAASLSSLSAALGKDFHLAITDIHHKNKKDAPSGTALMLGAATGRTKNDIKYASERTGDVIGEHHILFSGPAEQIEIIHKAFDRALFARGAVMAAHWLAKQKPGFYSMKDVLTL